MAAHPRKKTPSYFRQTYLVTSAPLTAEGAQGNKGSLRAPESRALCNNAVPIINTPYISLPLRPSLLLSLFPNPFPFSPLLCVLSLSSLSSLAFEPGPSSFPCINSVSPGLFNTNNTNPPSYNFLYLVAFSPITPASCASCLYTICSLLPPFSSSLRLSFLFLSLSAHGAR